MHLQTFTQTASESQQVVDDNSDLVSLRISIDGLRNAARERDAQLPQALEALSNQHSICAQLEQQLAEQHRETCAERVARNQLAQQIQRLQQEQYRMLSSTNQETGKGQIEAKEASQHKLEMEFDSFAQHVAELGGTIASLTADKQALEREKSELLVQLKRLQINNKVAVSLPGGVPEQDDVGERFRRLRALEVRDDESKKYRGRQLEASGEAVEESFVTQQWASEDESDGNDDFGNPRVVFDFGEGDFDASAAFSRERRAARTAQLSNLKEINEELRRENQILRERLSGLLEISKKSTSATVVAVADQSWALRAVQLVSRNDDLVPTQGVNALQDNELLTQSTEIQHQFTETDLKEQLSMARRNAKASTVAAQRAASDAQQQLRTLRTELGDMTARCAELLEQNESLAAQLQAAEDEYTQASRALIESGESQRRSQQARLDALLIKASKARDLARKLVVKLRSERSRHTDEVRALRDRLRATLGDDFQDDDEGELECASDASREEPTDSLSLSSEEGPNT